MKVLDETSIIGGFQKQSFIDWDGRTTAVIFTKGCNFRCGFCHNPALVLPRLFSTLPVVNVEEVIQYLKGRVGWLDGVVVTGGEPTIHATLPTLLERIKSLGFEIKLDTNGTNPKMVERLISSKLVNYVAMDIKTTLQEPNYQKIVRSVVPNAVSLVEQTLQVLRHSGIGYQLRTTVVPQCHTAQVVEALKVQFKSESYVLQEYRDGDTVEKLDLHA